VIQPLRKVSPEAMATDRSASSAERLSSAEDDSISLQEWHPMEEAGNTGTHVEANVNAVSTLPADLHSVHSLDALKLVMSIQGPLSIVFSENIFSALAGAPPCVRAQLSALPPL
jgi:hypothetical protein